MNRPDPGPTSAPREVSPAAAVPKGSAADPAPTSSTVRKVTKSTQELVGSLVSATPSIRKRNALFDDTPHDLDKVPGNLHLASDEQVEEALKNANPVALVKQLANDLAQRDAQITALRRRAEERERILKKMLQECEVSNMDIEARLRGLDRSKEQQDGANDRGRTGKRPSDYSVPGMHPEDPIDQRLALAMEDEVSAFPDFDAGAMPTEDEASIHSSGDAPKTTGRGNWKSYLFAGSKKSSRAPSVASVIDRDAEFTSTQNRSRASSGARRNRKPISNDLFVPPESDGGSGAIPTLRRLQSQDQIQQIKSASSSRKSSVSLASWALKMVAGNNQAGRNSNSTRGRPSNASEPTERTASQHSNRTGNSSKTGALNAQRRAPRASLGPNGTIKSISSDASKSNKDPPTQPHRGHSNLGPVEMDRILPEESRPPTLMQHHNHFASSQEYLTDRFGFIYDQRRKKRQSEAAAALARQKKPKNTESLGNDRSVLHQHGESAESEPAPSLPDADCASGSLSRPESRSSGEHEPGQPTKRWQDYLKLASTTATELLSHTPSTAPILETTEVEPAPAKSSSVTVAKRGSLPSTSSNPEPSPSRIVSGNAEFATASPSPGPTSPVTLFPPQADPVKALLEQLTEVHDALQREKTVKWNEFLRKVRAERKRQGDAISASEGSKGLTMPEALLTDGEIIGIAGLGNKGKLGRAKWLEFRRLVLGGIPVSYRAKIWTECSGASTLHIPGYYEDLVNNGEDNPSIVNQIQMDINRTLTDNIFFRKGPGVAKLNEVLLAYSRRNPEVGYCQGMNLITACLLLIMPTAEDAFWVLATMIENILPEKYYDQHLLTSRADQSVLREYVVELLPKLSAHLDLLEIELEALTFQWFLSVFTDCLSAEALYRVWDVVLCMHDGSTFLFQVALALLKLNEKALLKCETPAELYHYINHQMTNHAISIDSLIQASDALGKVVKRRDVEERRERAVAREQDLIRQREEARRAGKRRAVEPLQLPTDPEPSTEPDTAPMPQSELDIEARPPSISASLDTGLSSQMSPLRTPLSLSSTRSDEGEEAELMNQGLEELVHRTPLPIEEESLWRA